MNFNEKNKKLKTYITLLDDIGQKDFLMPIEEIRLGNQFAELKDPELLKSALLVDKYLDHKNFHVKRVIAIAFRSLEIFDDAKINQAMGRFLSDSAHWVVHDAIWYFKNAKTTDKQIIETIKDLSVKTPLTDEQLAETPPSSDPTVNMKWMADKTLGILR